MDKETLLKKYKSEIDRVINRAKASGLTDEQTKCLYLQSLRESELKISKKAAINRNVKAQCVAVLLAIALLIYILLNVHTPTSSIVLRNVQGFTYPTLKFIRTLSVPIIRLLPFLTDLYDETCLWENPLFYLQDMECWPCENVHSVIDCTGIDGIDALEKVTSGYPMVVRGKQPEVSLRTLQNLLKHSTLPLSGDVNIQNINNFIHLNESDFSSDVQLHWRFNKMVFARTIRKIFPKPSMLPERSGQSVERFLFIDGPTAEPYKLPNTECSFIFVVQGAGERTISLTPSSECSNHCKTISIVLKPSDTLFYNWWYWRPVSLPTSNKTNLLSISYINSYC